MTTPRMERTATTIWAAFDPTTRASLAVIGMRPDGRYDLFIRPARTGALMPLAEQPYPTFESANAAYEEWYRTSIA